MDTELLGYRYSLAKRIIYSVISFLKVLLPIFTLEEEIMKSVTMLQPFFLNFFDFISQFVNIVIFVGVVTLFTGAFTYVIFPVGETACLLATAIGYILSPRIEETFAAMVSDGADAWSAGAACAPWVFWICLPTIFVGAVCVCKRINKRGGLVRTLLISGLATLIVGLLLGLFAYLSYGTAIISEPARLSVFIAMVLVTIGEQIAIFEKKTRE